MVQYSIVIHWGIWFRIESDSIELCSIVLCKKDLYVLLVIHWVWDVSWEVAGCGVGFSFRV